eukprot:jgi/Chrzof1/8451/Cz03g11030.t1
MASSHEPTRKENMSLTWNEGTEEQLLKYVLENAVDNDPDSVLEHIDKFCWNTHWMMNLGDVKGRFLDEAIQQVSPPPAKSVLEVGLYCGYSTTRIAKQIAPEGKLFTIEPNEKHRRIADQILSKAGLRHKVDILAGTGAEVIPTLKGNQFDLVFIDHVKQEYYNDLQRIEQNGLLREGTVVVADNVVIFGDDVKDYLDHARNSGRYKSSKLHLATVEYDTERPDGVEVSIYKG